MRLFRQFISFLVVVVVVVVIVGPSLTANNSPKLSSTSNVHSSAAFCLVSHPSNTLPSQSLTYLRRHLSGQCAPAQSRRSQAVPRGVTCRQKKTRFRPTRPISARVISAKRLFRRRARESRQTSQYNSQNHNHHEPVPSPPPPIAYPPCSQNIRYPRIDLDMLSRLSIRAAAPRTLLKQKSGVVAAVPRSGMATATTPGLQYEVSDSAGVKVANRETGGPTGTLALVAKAGSRYQPFPGFADALEQFAFQVGLFLVEWIKRVKKNGGLIERTVYVETVSFADYSGGGIAGRCLLLDAV